MGSLNLLLLLAAVATSCNAAHAFQAQKRLPSIAVFGGSGQTGSECVFQALKLGESVCAMTRNASKQIPIPAGSGESLAGTNIKDSKLKVYQGDVTNQADVDRLFAENDIKSVIIALGGRSKDVGATMLQDGTRCIINAMKKSNVKRVTAITSIGAGDSITQAPFVFKMLMKTVMKKTMADKNKQEKLFLDNDAVGHDLEYCLVRPGQLGVGSPTGVVDVVDGKAGRIQRSDLAAFCLQAVREDDFPYLRRAVCLSSVGGTGWRKVKEEGFDAVTAA